MWATQRLLQTAESLVESVPNCGMDVLQTRLVEEANLLADQDVAINRRMGKFGAEVVPHGETSLFLVICIQQHSINS
jgi:methylthioribose-1-phosphate isomerase